MEVEGKGAVRCVVKTIPFSLPLGMISIAPCLRTDLSKVYYAYVHVYVDVHKFASLTETPLASGGNAG